MNDFLTLDYDDEVLTPAPVTVALGHPGEQVVFDADPATGLIRIDADDGSAIALDVEAFGLVCALMLNALGE